MQSEPQSKPRSKGTVLISIQTKVIIGLVLVTLIWGSTWLGIKIGLQALPPIFAAGLRFAIASGILFALMYVRGKKLPREKEFWKLALMLSFNTFGVPFALVYWGQKQIPTGLASILFATFPFCVALISHVRLPQEPLTLSKSLGILFGFGGIYVIFASEIAVESGIAVLGMGAVVLSAVLQGYALISVKKYAQSIDPFALNFAGMAGGGIILLSTSVLVEQFSALEWNAAAIGSVLYLSLFGSVMTFVIYFWLVKHVQAVLLSLTAFVTPIIAVLLGALVLQEQLGTQVVSGSALVLGGIVVANMAEIWKFLKWGRALIAEERLRGNS